ncbi:MAG: DUF2149 domain-containing protein, partial [Anaerovoracaceae bacterium]
MRTIKNKSRLRINRKSEEVNPMDGMASLADVMLVFACGLIVALIAAWNVDVAADVKVPKEVEAIGNETQHTTQSP